MSLRLVIVLWLIAMTIAGSVHAEPVERVDDPLEEAQSFLEAGRLFPAERAARAAIEAAPESAEAHWLLGRILARRAKLEEADEALSRAAELDPALPGLQRTRAQVLFELDEFDRASAALELALEESPEDAGLWMQLGLCRLALEQPSEAIVAFERAALDPDLAGLARYNIGVARSALGDHAAARAAFEDALQSGLPGSIAARASRRLGGGPTPGVEEPKWWSMQASLGPFFESAVIRPETDDLDRDPDWGGEFALDLGGKKSIDGWEGKLGYGFYQKAYRSRGTFDIQSHTLSGQVGRSIGPVRASLGYVYSASLLGADASDHFLDFHEVRATAGGLVTPYWYGSLSPALRVKRFPGEEDRDPGSTVDRGRDAVTGVVSLLQLFPLDRDWSRHLLASVTYEYENAGTAFDYHGVQAQGALHLPLDLLGEEWSVDLRYLYQRRDYLHEVSLDLGARGKARIDQGHFARIRLTVPIAGPVSVRTEYEFERVFSRLDSVDRTVHQTSLQLRVEL